MKVALHTINGKTFAYSNQEFAEIAKFKEGGDYKMIEVPKFDTIEIDHIEIELTDDLESNTIYIRPTVNDGEETSICYDFNFTIEHDYCDLYESHTYTLSVNDFDNTDASNRLKQIVNDAAESAIINRYHN